MREKRCYVSGTIYNSNFIMAAGGFNERERIRSTELYNIENNQWTNIQSMASIRFWNLIF